MGADGFRIYKWHKLGSCPSWTSDQYEMFVAAEVCDKRWLVLAESELLRSKEGPTQPLQVYLALTQKSDEMRVKWVSDNVTKPVVQYGHENGKLVRLARATQSSYRAEDMCLSTSNSGVSHALSTPWT